MEARCFSFKSFVLMPSRQTLLRRGAPVHLGTRALDILTVLVERRGTVVDKQELMSLVWADTFVDSSNLKVHIAALRRVLDGDGSPSSCIATVNGRGYRFVEPVVNCAAASSGERLDQLQRPPHQEERLYGRREFIQQVVTAVEESRLVTVVGTAGVGKTAVARAVAGQLERKYEHETCFVDLSSLGDAGQLPMAIAEALGIARELNGVEEDIWQHLRSAEMLLILDTCESIIGGAAAFVESIQSSCPRLHVLTTSREILGVSGERVLRLQGLHSPSAGSRVTAAEAVSYPAVQLFLDRAAETFEDRELIDADAAIIAAICAELEGLPLGIELAARRVRALGFSGLPSVLNEQFYSLHHGERTGPTRHQSLATALDWSLDLLPEEERLLLLRLSKIEGHFDLDAGIAEACDVGTNRAETVSCIANLVSKSLIERHGRGNASFRLPNFLRYYLLRRLSEDLAWRSPRGREEKVPGSRFLTFPSKAGQFRRALQF
jgi:predicted ATPase/DNA-binding winged helix-turn-helix (wHTH) protein